MKKIPEGFVVTRVEDEKRSFSGSSHKWQLPRVDGDVYVVVPEVCATKVANGYESGLWADSRGVFPYPADSWWEDMEKNYVFWILPYGATPEEAIEKFDPANGGWQ